MSGVGGANYHYSAFSPNNLALRTYFFYGCFYFHVVKLKPLYNPAFAAIFVYFKGNFISNQNPNPMHSHFAGKKT